MGSSQQVDRGDTVCILSLARIGQWEILRWADGAAFSQMRIRGGAACLGSDPVQRREPGAGTPCDSAHCARPQNEKEPMTTTMTFIPCIATLCPLFDRGATSPWRASLLRWVDGSGLAVTSN